MEELVENAATGDSEVELEVRLDLELLLLAGDDVEITEELVKYTESLVQDLYGNYVIQFVLKLPGLHNYKTIIAEKMAKMIPALSRQKYSSNVNS